MAGLESMSTEELIKLRDEKRAQPAPQAAEQPKVSTKDIISKMSTMELMKLKEASPQERNDILTEATKPGVGEQILDGVIAVGEFIDKFTGAPTRAAVGELIPSRPRIDAPVAPGLEVIPKSGFLGTDASKSPDFGGGASIGGAISKFGEQFGEDPRQAPTGKELATQLGASPEDTAIGISPAGAAGFGLDMLLDPLNIIPVSAIGRALGKGTKFAVKGSAGAAKTVALKVPGVAPTIDVVKEASKGTTEALTKLFKPKVADDFAELAEIAKSNGINANILPEAVEFGEGSVISRAARVQREGPLGEQLLVNFEEGLDKVRAAAMRQAEDIGAGANLSRVEAGTAIREGLDESAAILFDGVENTYKSVGKGVPNLTLSARSEDSLFKALTDMQDVGTKRAKGGFSALDKSQGHQMLDAVDSVFDAGDSYDALVGKLADIGKIAFKSKNPLDANPPDIVELRKLYHSVKDVIFETIEDKLPDGAKTVANLKKSNKAMSEFFDDKSIVSKVIGNPNIGPERVYSSLVNDTKKIEVLKNILPEQKFNQVKAVFMRDILKPDLDGGFQFRGAISRLKNKQDVARALMEPEELKNFSNVLRLGERFGIAVMSTSGTGASNFFRDIVGSVKQAITNDAFIKILKDKAHKLPPAPKAPSAFSGFKLPSSNKFDFGIKGTRLTGSQSQEEK